MKEVTVHFLKPIVLLFLSFQFVMSQDFVTPPETLIVEGVPRIPSFIKQRFEKNLVWEESEFKGWSSDGEKLIGLSNKNVFFMNSPQSKMEKTKVSLTSSDYLQFQPKDGKSFLFTVDDPNDTFHRVLYQYDAVTGLPILLTKPDEIQMVGSYEWSVDSKSVYYSNQNTKDGYSEIFCLDLNSMKHEFIGKYEGDANYLIDASKDFLVIKNYFSNNQSIYYLLNLVTKKLTPISSKEASVNEASVSKTGNGIWFFSDKERDSYDLYYYDIGTKKTTKANNFVANMTNYSLSPDENLIALKISEYGADFFRIFEMNGKQIGKELSRPQLPSGVIGNFEWRNSEELGFDFQSTTTPSEISSFNIKNGFIKKWTKSEIGTGLVGKLGATQLIKWESFDGRIISGFMIEPKMAGNKLKLPVIIDVHGGPDSQYTPTFDGYLNNLSSELPAVIISPNVRGSSGFGKDFLDLDNKEKREDAIKDLQALIDWIERQPTLDSDRIFVRGTSYGGFIALALGLKEQSRIKGITAFVPLISLKEYLEFVTSSRKERDEKEFGSLSDIKLMKKLEKLSLLYPNNLDNWKIPVFLITAKDDKSASAATVDKLKDQLMDKGIPVWYIKATNEGHSWINYPNYEFYELAGFTFFKKLAF